MVTIDNVTKIANYLKISPGNLSLNKEQVVTRTIQDAKISGLSTILNAMTNESKNLQIKNCLNNPEVQQWIDYAVLYIAASYKDKHASQCLLKELNNYLLTRSYFVGHFITLADLAIFYSIYDLMKSLSPIEKENCLNLSRWFNHLQQQKDIIQDASEINFSVIHLHSISGTHL